MQRNVTFIQKFRPLQKRRFGIMVIKKKPFCYHITFHMKFGQNKILYLRQHFEETVKPGKKFCLEITEGFSECVVQQTRVKKQHLYSPVIYCKWLSTLNTGTTVYENIFPKFANIFIQLVLILMRMMITPSIPCINIVHSLVRHKKWWSSPSHA